MWQYVISVAEIGVVVKLSQVCAAFYRPAKLRLGGHVITLKRGKGLRTVAVRKTDGVLFVGEEYRITQIAPSGEESNVAGTGKESCTFGPNASISFGQHLGLCVDERDGSVYVADKRNKLLRKVTSGGVESIVAGHMKIDDPEYPGFLISHFASPSDVAVDYVSGDVYVTDSARHTIYKVSLDGSVSEAAGGATRNAFATHKDGPIAQAIFYCPEKIALDHRDGSLYIVQTGNDTIRKISNGIVSTVAGGRRGFEDGPVATAKFGSLGGIVVDERDGALYVADSTNCVIRKITVDGNVTTVAGTPGEPGEVDGCAKVAKFRYPEGIAIFDSALFIADNSAIRMLSLA